MHRLAVSGLPFHVAMDLIGTIADTSEAKNTLLDNAAPGLRTLSPAGRLSEV